MHLSKDRPKLQFLFFIVVIFGALVFWISPHPPMVDLPQHAGQIALLKEIVTGTCQWKDFFQVNLVTPYLSGYGITLLFAFLMPIDVAMKASLSLAYVGFVFACTRVRKSLKSDPRLDWLLIPAFFGLSYSWGFFSFLVAAPICIWFIYCAAQYSEDRCLRRGVSLLLVGILLLVSHGMSFVLGWGIGVAFLLIRFPRMKASLLSTVPYGILALLAIAFYLAGKRMDGTLIGNYAPMQFGHRPILRLTEMLRFTFSSGREANVNSFLIIAPAAILMVAAPVLLRLRVDWRKPTCWVPFFGVCVLFFTLPTFANNTAFLYERFSLFLLPTFAWMFSRRSLAQGGDRKADGVLSSLGLVLLIVSVMFFLGVTSLNAWKFARETNEFDTVVRTLDPGQRALGLIFDSSSVEADNRAVYLHYAAWYQAERHGLYDFNFAWFTPQIVRYLPEHRPPSGETSEWRPGEFDWKLHRGSDYKYFFVRGDDGLASALFKGADCAPRLLKQTGSWKIFENCGTPGKKSF
jgi:hypothetical protein